MGSSPEEDRQNEETLSHLIQEICALPVPATHPRPEAAIHELAPENLMAELGDDKEVQELLLRKVREKGLSKKLLAELMKG